MTIQLQKQDNFQRKMKKMPVVLLGLIYLPFEARHWGSGGPGQSILGPTSQPK